MRKQIIVLVASLLCAIASVSATAADLYRFKDGVVGVGDSIGALIKRAGQPDRVVQLQNKFGAGVGERWEYYSKEKTVLVEIEDGKVTSISVYRN